MGPRMHDAIDSHVDVWVKELPWLDPVKEEVLSRIDRIAGHVNAGRAETFAANESALWQYKTLLTLRKVLFLATIAKRTDSARRCTFLRVRGRRRGERDGEPGEAENGADDLAKVERAGHDWRVLL